MTEKKYLRWYNKVGYGSGDIAGNVVYALLSSFVMIFLTNTVGLSSGIVGTLIAVSKLFDGVTDIFFGAMIDKTHTRMGKARPWMLWGYVGCAVTLAAIFFIPADLGDFAKYAWFFIAYTLLNAVFYTANNIAYSALTALVTKNSAERVQMGSIRFVFAFGTSLLIQSVTVRAVAALGGGAAGWRWVAIIYAVIGLVTNTLSVLSVKELPEEELAEDSALEAPAEKYSLADAARLLVYRAAQAKQNHEPYAQYAAMSKLFAAEAAVDITRRCIDLVGLDGVSRGYPFERFLRDAKITETYEGTSEVQRTVISASMRRKA